MTVRTTKAPPANAQGAPHVGESTRVNSLGLSRPEVEAVLDLLDADSAVGASSKRKATRMPFRMNGVKIEISQPGGGQTQILVACRNLSRQGLGFLHSSYLHVGTRCSVTLPHRTQGEVRIAGQVVRCRHVSRHIHEVGLKLEEPLNLRDFLRIDSLSERYTYENVDPEALRGRVIVVHEYVIERKLITSLLEGSSLDIVECKSIEEGVAGAQLGAAIVLCDQTLEHGSIGELVRALREQRINAPVVCTCNEVTPEVKQALQAAKVDGLICKPIDRERLLRVIAEFMFDSGREAIAESEESLRSTLAGAEALKPLIEEFVADMHQLAPRIQRALASGDAAGVQQSLVRIMGTGGSMGYATVSKAAEAALRALAGGGLQSAKPSIVTLCGMLKRVRP
ncbi:MAG TPA: response regulator [Phycisphaerales bacterium]|nr:response regulator [Phycisphaerales bacterium]